LLILVVLVALAYWMLHWTSVQNFIVRKVAANLSEKLHTKVSVKHVDFSLFNKMSIEGVYIEDLKKDTLLYAGAIKVRITDWFFLKDEATIHVAEIDDAYINLNRTDSVWNYTFITDYFSSPSTPNAPKKKGLDLDLKDITLNRLRLVQTDKWVGKDMRAEIGQLRTVIDSFDIAAQTAVVRYLTLDKPVFAQSNYTGNRPENLRSKLLPSSPANSKTDTLPQSSPGWSIIITKLTLNNGRFINEKETIRTAFTDHFDGQHLDFTDINAVMDNLVFKNNTLTTKLNLAAKEKNGLRIHSLLSVVKVDPTIMEFDSLALKVNNSFLSNYYAMKYSDFNDDMSDFMTNVTLEGRFKESIVNSDDIALFAPALKSWKKIFQLSGEVTGTIDNLKARKMRISSGATDIDGDLVLRGLPDINETFIDFRGNNVQTTAADLSTIIPALKNTGAVRLDQLGNIRYKGNFTGLINDFVTFGTFKTNLGTLSGDLNMKLLPGKAPVYSGRISTPGFALGRFIGNNQIGQFAVDGTVKGQGFTAKDLNLAFDGRFPVFEYGGKRYQNITLNSTLTDQVFTGKASINDPSLEVQDFEGKITFGNKTPFFNCVATLNKANLQALGLTNDDFKLNGRFKLDFTGNTIDNFLGEARIYDATLLHNNQRLSFDSLTLRSLLLDDGRKQLSLHSNEADALITGNFKIQELPDAFSYFLSNYFPAYIPKPTRALSPQRFDFNIETNQIEEYVKLLDSRIGGFNQSVISGSLNLADNLLDLRASVPQFTYVDTKFEDIKITGQGDADSLTGLLEAGNIALNDSLRFPGSRVTFATHNDVSRVSISTSASKTLSQAELNATVQTFNDGVKIHFSPSSFIVNDKLWQLEKDGELVLRKSVFDASEVKFVQGQQEITLSAEPSPISNSTDLVARLRKINLNDFVPLFTTKPRLEGLFTGKIKIIDPFGKAEYELEEGTAENFLLDNKPLGDVRFSETRLGKNGILNLDISANNAFANFEIKGQVDLKDSSDRMVNLVLTSKKLSLDILEPYLGGIFSDIGGNAVSDLRFTSSPKGKNELTGSVAISNGALRVKYTQCLYRFSNETIIFNPGEIDFGSMIITDTLNNKGTVTGKIYHTSFDNFSFDNIRLQTPRMLLLNTQKKDNDQFYGKVIGNATMEINGKLNDLRIDMSGEPSRLESDNNHIYLPGGTGRETGAFDYVDMVQFGTEMENVRTRKEGSSISINMDIKANPACKVDVILDEVTGDIIRGEGEGRLNIQTSTNDKLTIRGRYNLTKGSYDFNFQSVLQRPFSLSKGYINWSGDPYEAEINIDAEYLATKVNFSAITGNRNQTADLKVVAHLTQTLKKPGIGLEFSIPSYESISSDFLVTKKIAEYKRDSTEMNKQVSAVLLFNSFITSDQNFFGAGNSYSFATNTLGQILSAYLTNNFSRFLQRALNDPNITSYFDITSQFDVKQSVDAIRAAARFGIVKSYLNNRLIISLGGNLDYSSVLPNTNNAGANLLLTPDFSMEWLLSKDGNVRVVGFRRTNIDWAYGQRNRQGVSLSYKKDFDRFNELFAPSTDKIIRRESKKKKKTAAPPQ
jgi:hypothetical protein